MIPSAAVAFMFTALYVLTFTVGALSGAVGGYFVGRPRPDRVKKELGEAYDAGYAAGREDAEEDLLEAAAEGALRDADEPDGTA